jgi:hypothetical protein
MRPQQILLYTRPWEVEFHLEMECQLRDHYADVPVRYVTFFIEAARRVRAAGGEVTYMPDAVRAVTGAELSRSRLQEIDRTLYETGGANFNLMLQSERFLPKDSRLAEQFGLRHLVVLDRLVGSETLSSCAMYDHFVYWLGGALANARNGAHFAFVGCGTPAGRVLALKSPWDTWQGEPLPEEQLEQMAEACRTSLDIPPERRIRYMMPQVRPKRSFQNRLRLLRDVNYDRRAGSYFAEDFISIPRWIMEKIVPRRWHMQPVPEYDVATNESLASVQEAFVYLPLHMEPEAVILMYSPWLRDQVEVVRLAAQSLPIGWRLLVKENPKMAGVRHPAFYRSLQQMPNVRLVAPAVSSTELIRRSAGVLTLAGTTAIEAGLLGKSAVCLGSPPFAHLLDSADLASGRLQLRRLFECWGRSGASAWPQAAAWHKWIRATFVADSVISAGRVDPSAANVRAYVSYMQSCSARMSAYR